VSKISDLESRGSSSSKARDDLLDFAVEVLEADLIRSVNRDELRNAGIIAGPQLQTDRERSKIFQSDVDSRTIDYYSQRGLPKSAKPQTNGGASSSTSLLEEEEEGDSYGCRLPPKAYDPNGSWCRKQYRRDEKVYAGDVFIVNCTCTLGTILYIMFLDSGESPRSYFHILRRMKKVPGYVFYDNACHLHHFAMCREPHEFYRTIFLIDRFHRRNHTTCSPVYDCKWWSKMNPFIKAANTQICEQHNSFFQRNVYNIRAMGLNNAENVLELTAEIRNTWNK
jgi:hypothetical protein